MDSKLIKYDIESDTDPLNILKNNTVYDLAFLDIQMNTVDGISLAQELKNRNSKIILFFITSFNEYQDDTMDLRAFRFFEKPLLYSSLDKAMEYLDETYIDLYLNEKKVRTRILVDNIFYIENRNRKVIMHTKNGTHIIGKKLEEWHDILPNTFFTKYTNHF